MALHGTANEIAPIRSTGALPSILVSLAILLYLGWTYIAYRRLAHIPGPKLNAFSTLPIITYLLTGKAWTKEAEWIAKYGPLVRTAPGHLISSDAQLYRKMHAARSPYQRGDFFYAMRFKPGHDNVLSMRDEKRHAELRQKMSAGYGGREVPSLEADVDAQVLSFVDLIERKYLSKPDHFRPMDLATKVHYFALDVISSVAFGEAFGDLRDDNDNFDYLHEVAKSLPIIAAMAKWPKLYLFLERSQVLNFLMPSETDALGLGKAIFIATRYVSQRLGSGSETVDLKIEAKVEDKMDMLGSFIRHGMTRKELESETVLQIIAGSDTTATAIRTTFLHIFSSPMVYRRLMHEIDATSIKGDVISDEEARSLKYLQACIKEGLRLWPPVAGVMEMEVPKGGDTIDGRFVPGGTRIGAATRSLFRDPKVYGEDSDMFRPERWLLDSDPAPYCGDCNSPDILQQMERHNELVFSYGRSSCLGKNVAFMELNKIFVEMLRRFNWQLCDARQPMHVDFHTGLFTQSEMWVRISRRSG